MASILTGAGQGLGAFHGAQYFRRISEAVNPMGNNEAIRSEGENSLQSEYLSSETSRSSASSNSVDTNPDIVVDVSKRRLLERKIDKVDRDSKLLKVYDSLIAIIAIAGLVVAMVEYEENYSNDDVTTSNGDSLRLFVSVSTGVLLILLIFRSKTSYSIMREKKIGLDVEVPSYFKSKHFGFLLVELVVCAIHWPPGSDYSIEFQQLNGVLIQSMDSICACWMLIRVYLVFRLFYHYSTWSSKKSQAICSVYGCDASILFSIKSLLKDRPYFLLGFSMITNLVVFGLAIRIFERPYTKNNPNQSQDFNYIWNAMWVIIITMTTVGYGDFYARTHIGRFISVLACFWGIFNITLMVVTLSNYTAFNKGEEKVYNYLGRTTAMENAKIHAAKFIRAAYQRYLLIKHGGKQQKYLHERREKTYEMRIHYEKFKEQKKLALFAEQSTEEMLRVLSEGLNIKFETINFFIKQAHDLKDQIHEITRSQKKSKEALKTAIKSMEIVEEEIDKYASLKYKL
ncbi:unnamed protein product [Blepharisma stoltei]|uniref:Potassium channel domain-containing protein n=1 Tax=Blepharisma stoltei TaxID=1481888 RepID=A0AAU9IPA9_9CILI|nr:unnamed protein product [Blepharisma stoltei]